MLRARLFTRRALDRIQPRESHRWRRNRFTNGFEDITQEVTNPDGTITLTARRTGHLSHNVGGVDTGLFDFQLTVDPTTGAELSFQILRHAGQIGGMWSGEVDLAAYCAQFAG